MASTINGCARVVCSIKLWGRISGTNKDYIIAAGLREGLTTPVKELFFW